MSPGETAAVWSAGGCCCVPVAPCHDVQKNKQRKASTQGNFKAGALTKPPPSVTWGLSLLRKWERRLEEALLSLCSGVISTCWLVPALPMGDTDELRSGEVNSPPEGKSDPQTPRPAIPGTVPPADSQAMACLKKSIPPTLISTIPCESLKLEFTCHLTHHFYCSRPRKSGTGFCACGFSFF